MQGFLFINITSLENSVVSLCFDQDSCLSIFSWYCKFMFKQKAKSSNLYNQHNKQSRSKMLTWREKTLKN
jgi:hypothetical protein